MSKPVAATPRDDKFNVMCKYLRPLLPDNKAIVLRSLTLDFEASNRVIISFGTDHGENCIPVAFDRKTANQIISDILCPSVEVSTVKHEEEKPVTIEKPKEEKPKKEEAAVQSKFEPPTEILATDRQRLSKPGEQDLLNSFVASYPDPFKGRKKLTLEEKNYQEKREKNIDIARSYILNGNRRTVESWIDHIKRTMHASWTP